MKAITLVEAHAQDIYDYLTDPEQSPDIFFDRPKCVQETRDWIFSLRVGGDYGYAVVSENKVVGIVTLRGKKRKQYQIGFYFKVSARGKIAGAVREVLEYFHGTTIVATPYPDNIRCAKFLTKLGFHYSHSEVEYDEWVKENR